MKRSKFSLSHYKLLTGNMGYLIPLTWYEVLPGDTIQQVTSMLVRIQPLNTPVMHPVTLRVHHWFVPNRLVWDDWEEFITGGEDGTATPTHPYKALTTNTEGWLADYLGVPAVGAFGNTINVSALPARAYSLIFNEFYRDQDLTTAHAIDTTDGADTTSWTLQRVAWPKDRFTTARPWQQKGTAITIPMAGSAPVLGIGKHDQTWSTGPQTVYESGQSGSTSFADYQLIDPTTNAQKFYVEEDPSNANYPGIYADLSSATGISIHDLRENLALQRFMENRARYGGRFPEYLMSQFGVRSADARLQRPEYIGGGKSTIAFSEVLSTADSGSYNPGDMLGHGISAMRTRRFRKFFPEHGVFMTLLSAVPKPIYAQGLHKSFSRTTKEDYFQKELQYLGDQEVYNKEIYIKHTTPEGTFGYNRIYDSYRQLPSTIAGEFMSTRDEWHMARIFSSDPALNDTFTNCEPTTRVYQSTATDQMLIMANHSIQARRCMAKQPMPRTF